MYSKGIIVSISPISSNSSCEIFSSSSMASFLLSAGLRSSSDIITTWPFPVLSILQALRGAFVEAGCSAVGAASSPHTLDFHPLYAERLVQIDTAVPRHRLFAAIFAMVNNLLHLLHRSDIVCVRVECCAGKGFTPYQIHRELLVLFLLCIYLLQVVSTYCRCEGHVQNLPSSSQSEDFSRQSPADMVMVYLDRVYLNGLCQHWHNCS